MSAVSGLVEAPSIVADDDDENRLVAAVRRGDDRAFEALYSRYQRRIHAYVVGMVKDHGRAEDVTQEVFVAALRRMRATERPIAFRPWIYEIAKNACIDQYRRTRRTEEVSLEGDEGLAPADYGKLVNSDPTPEAAVANKQDLDNLCGALGGLSDAHHEILVLREFEGLSYQEIGERMNMSRPAVESTLFRARRRLTEEFDELVTGARCLRIQSLIATASETRLGTRESRRLSRHISHCQPCRREAMVAGLDSAILTHVPLRRRAAAKIAGLLPFPLVTRSRGGGGGGDASLASSSGGGWMANLPLLSEQLAGGWGKLATAAVVLVAGAGAAGVGSQVVAAGPGTESRDRPAQERTSGATDRGGSSAAKARTVAPAAEGKRTAGRAGRAAADRRKAAARAKRDGGPGSSGGSGSGGGGGVADTIPAVTGGGGAGGVVDRVTAPAGGTPSIPNAELPTGGTTPTIERLKSPSPPSPPAPPSLPAVPKVDSPRLPATGGAGASLPEPIKGAAGEATGAVESATGVDLP